MRSSLSNSGGLVFWGRREIRNSWRLQWNLQPLRAKKPQGVLFPCRWSCDVREHHGPPFIIASPLQVCGSSYKYTLGTLRHPPIMFLYSILALSPGRCHTSGKVSQDFPGEASSNESKIMLWLCSKQLSRFCWKWSCSSRTKSMKHQTYYGNIWEPHQTCNREKHQQHAFLRRRSTMNFQFHPFQSLCAYEMCDVRAEFLKLPLKPKHHHLAELFRWYWHPQIRVSAVIELLAHGHSLSARWVNAHRELPCWESQGSIVFSRIGQSVSHWLTLLWMVMEIENQWFVDFFLDDGSYSLPCYW